MIPFDGQTIHIVNGRQLSEKQYADYMYGQGAKACRERIVFELAGLIDLRNKPETLCTKFLDWLETQLRSLQGKG